MRLIIVDAMLRALREGRKRLRLRLHAEGTVATLLLTSEDHERSFASERDRPTPVEILRLPLETTGGGPRCSVS